MNTTIFSQVDDYLVDLFSLQDDVLRRTEQSIVDHGMPEHSVSANQGQFLFTLARMCQARRIVEIGTLGGYSTIWLARALAAEGKLTTIEIEPDFAAVAKENIAQAGLSDRVEVQVGDALSLLAELEEDTTPVDLLFMDADKPNYVAYFDWALKMSRSGTLIVADNVIRAGKVLDANSQDEKVVGVRKYNKMLAENQRVTTSILQNVGQKEYDGVAISVVR